jgi:hypothetical protein
MVIDFTKEKAGTTPKLKLEWEYSGSQAATPSAAGRRIARGVSHCSIFHFPVQPVSCQLTGNQAIILSSLLS